MTDYLTINSFVVLDTEGKDYLTEVAIADTQGNICYEAFIETNHWEPTFRINTQPLETIVTNIAAFCQDKLIICHYAKHDDRILRRSFEQVGLTYPHFQFICTLKLAKQRLNQTDYSLSYLCKTLDLRVDGQRFDDRRAHNARYDVLFTYQLYHYLYNFSYHLPTFPMSEPITKLYQNVLNPFSNIRVNTPFEAHPDVPEIYRTQFNSLKAVLHEIKHSPNHQSQGAIVLGEPGSGKTHLMMRLAQEILKTNRLFFIRHPNNYNAVNYHTYARILESFSEEIESIKITQLEQFFARSFVNILSQTGLLKTERGRQMIDKLKDDNLSLYQRVGQPGTDRYRQNWDSIEKRILAWWQEKYGLTTDYSSQVLKGIMRFCRYKEANRKSIIRHWLAGNQEAKLDDLSSVGLTPWPENFNREEFALEAIQTLGKLSLLDEPIILIFDQLESLFEERNCLTLESFGSMVKEILTHVPNSLIILNLFPDRWQHFQTIFDSSVIDRISQSVVTLDRPSEPQLRQLLHTLSQQKVEANSSDPTVDINILCTEEELTEILNQPSIRSVIKRASDYFRYKVQDIPLPPLPSPPSSTSVDIANFKQQLQDLYTGIGEAIALYNKIENLEKTERSPLPQPLPDPFSELDLDLVDLPIDSQPIPLAEPEPSSLFLLDEYWNNALKKWGTEYKKPRIVSDEDDTGKLMTIVSVFCNQYNLKVEQLSAKRQLPNHLCITTDTQTHVFAFLQNSGIAFTARIKNLNQLVLSRQDIKFRLMRDRTESEITGSVGKKEIAKLKAAKNGDYVIINQRDRILFECLYQLIVDFENKELDFNLTIDEIIDSIACKLNDYWLIQSLTQ